MPARRGRPYQPYARQGALRPVGVRCAAAAMQGASRSVTDRRDAMPARQVARAPLAQLHLRCARLAPSAQSLVRRDAATAAAAPSNLHPTPRAAMHVSLALSAASVRLRRCRARRAASAAPPTLPPSRSARAARPAARAPLAPLHRHRARPARWLPTLTVLCASHASRGRTSPRPMRHRACHASWAPTAQRARRRRLCALLVGTAMPPT